MRTLLTVIWLTISSAAFADYLVVQRNGNLRAEPSTESEILEKIRSGDVLQLIEDEKTNGYWHVQAGTSGQEGWVFQTLVRKISGDTTVSAPPAADNSVVDIRILDVGAGHSALIKLPGDKFVIYDAGSDALLNGDSTLAQIKRYIPAGSTIELLVLSHTDADHISAAGQVVRDYKVKKVLWTGFDASMVGGTATRALKRLKENLRLKPETENVNLHELDSTIAPGTNFNIGNVKFTLLCGFGNPHPDWEGLSKSEKLNSVSIVMRLDFRGNSVLFTGDAVGRHANDGPDALLATEEFLVNNAASFLPSTVVIAPHHGAKNGSSAAFVDLVKPEWVVFPAGHDHKHPTTRTAQIYLQFTTVAKMLRTDRGDDEGSDEWPVGRRNGCHDKFGDDTIQIQLRGNGTFRLYYLTADGPCRQ